MTTPVTTNYGGGLRADLNGVTPNSASDQTDAIAAFIAFGGELYFPDGDYKISKPITIVVDGDPVDIKSGVSVVLAKSTTIRCSPGARFYGVDLETELFYLYTDKNADLGVGIDFHWEGGVIDMRQMKVSSSVPYESGTYAPVNTTSNGNTDGLAIYGATSGNANQVQGIKTCTIKNVTFLASNHDWITAGGDAGLSIGVGSALIEGNYFRGCRDLGIYASSNNRPNNNNSGDFKIIGNKFDSCMYGCTVKRGAHRTVINGNTFKNCVQAIGIETIVPASPLVAVRNACVSITGNAVDQYCFGIDIFGTDGVTITGNVLTNAGILVDPSGTNTFSVPTSYFLHPEAISLRGCNAAVVTGNSISGLLSGYSGSNYGIILRRLDISDGAGLVKTQNALVHGNLVSDLSVPVSFDLGDTSPHANIRVPEHNVIFANKIINSSDTTWNYIPGRDFDVNILSGAVKIGDGYYPSVTEAIDAGAVTISRPSVQWVLDTASRYSQVGSNVVPISNAGIMLEPERTNLLIYNQGFDTSSWTKNGSGVTATGGKADIFGASNGAEIFEATATNSALKSGTAITMTAVWYTASFIVKPNTATWHYFVAGNSTFTTRAEAWVDLSTTPAVGTVRSVGTGWVTTTPVCTVTPLADGYRLVQLSFKPAAGSVYVETFTTNANDSFTRSGSGKYTICHVQVEEGADGSSPIFTSGAASTRKLGVLKIHSGDAAYDIVSTLAGGGTTSLSGALPILSGETPSLLTRIIGTAI